MNVTAMDFERSVLSRLIDPDNPDLPADAARGILSLKFPPSDQERMTKLAEKARHDILTSEEQAQADSYERIGSFLALLQSKARLSLKKSSPNGGQSTAS